MVLSVFGAVPALPLRLLMFVLATYGGGFLRVLLQEGFPCSVVVEFHCFRGKRSSPRGLAMRNGTDTRRRLRFSCIAKCKWGAVLKPVLPDNPKHCPGATRSP